MERPNKLEILPAATVRREALTVGTRICRILMLLIKTYYGRVVCGPVSASLFYFSYFEYMFESGLSVEYFGTMH